MKYYINEKEVTEEEARQQERENKKALKTGNLETMKNIKFIVKIGG